MRVALHSITFDRAESADDTFIDVWIRVIGNDFPSAWRQVHQALECCLYRFQVGIDVGMIKLHRSQDNGLRKVVQEFGALVEEGRVVFVAFDDEVLALLQSKTAVEILRDASNQERWIFPG